MYSDLACVNTGVTRLICRGSARGIGHWQRELLPRKLSGLLQEDLCERGCHHLRAMVDFADTMHSARRNVCVWSIANTRNIMKHGRLLGAKRGTTDLSQIVPALSKLAVEPRQNLTTRECAYKRTLTALQHQSAVLVDLSYERHMGVTVFQRQVRP